MSDQRVKLANKINQRLWFSATIGKFTHKKIRGGGKGPVLLLLDLNETDKKGHITDPDLADHVWVNADKNIFDLGSELFPDDEIMFSAVVKTYGIVRHDVLQKREEIVSAANSKNKEIFGNYREDYLDWKDTWQNVLQANAEAKRKLQKGEIDRRTYQEIERQNIQQYKASQPNGVAVKNSELSNSKQAQHDKKLNKLIDYQLEDLQNVRFIKQKRLRHGWTRLKITKKDQQKIKFTKYLAARSYAYSNNVSYDVFDNKK